MPNSVLQIDRMVNRYNYLFIKKTNLFCVSESQIETGVVLKGGIFE